MTPNEIRRLIDLAYAQWPKLEPQPDAVLFWTAGLAGYTFAEASTAVIKAGAKTSMPPVVNDVLAELEPDRVIGWQDAWAAAAAALAAGKFAYRLDPSDFPNRRAWAAARSVQYELRMQPADKARWVFRDAYEAQPDSDWSASELNPAQQPELPAADF